MNTNQQLISGVAMHEFLESQGSWKDLPADFDAKLRKFDSLRHLGNIEFTAIRPDAHESPVIRCSPGIMKSFDIPFDDFDPKFQEFSFDSSQGELRILCRNQYDFVLYDIQKKKCA